LLKKLDIRINLESDTHQNNFSTASFDSGPQVNAQKGGKIGFLNQSDKFPDHPGIFTVPKIKFPVLCFREFLYKHLKFHGHFGKKSGDSG